MAVVDRVTDLEMVVNSGLIALILGSLSNDVSYPARTIKQSSLFHVSER